MFLRRHFHIIYIYIPDLAHKHQKKLKIPIKGDDDGQMIKHSSFRQNNWRGEERMSGRQELGRLGMGPGR